MKLPWWRFGLGLFGFQIIAGILARDLPLGIILALQFDIAVIWLALVEIE